MTSRSAIDMLREMVAMFDTGDTSQAGEVVAADYLDHQGLGNGPMRSVQGFVDVVAASRAGYESKDVTVEDVFGTDDRAVARIRWIGTRTNGDHVDRETIDIIRVTNSQAIEHWGAHS